MWDWEKETARMYIYDTYGVFFCAPLSFKGLTPLGGVIHCLPCMREGRLVCGRRHSSAIELGQS